MGLKVLGNLKGIVRDSDRVATEVRRSFDGLVASVWMDEYLATRLTTLHDELARLSEEVSQLK